MSEVRYGTAGWSFQDWYGAFYPTPAAAAEGPGSLFTGVLEDAPDPDVALAKRQPLRYYARFFDLVEVNSSFYGIPRRTTTESWARQTDERPAAARPFWFTFKLPQPMSHQGVLEPREVDAFREALAPLRERDRLAGVLAQFPQHFPFSEASQERLRRIRAALPDLDLIAEVRHTTWASPAAADFLASLELSLASIDMPQGRNTLEPATTLTRPKLAYVRLHGRNAQAWFDPKAGRDDKYDYLYGEGELDEWAERIAGLSRLADRTLVVANNHFRGKAPANALELRARAGERVAVPRPLSATYARLGRLGS